MQHQEIIDTIKVGDYVEVKGDHDFEDGVYEVMSVDKFDDGASVRLYNKRNILWVYDRCIVRKISDGETEQDSQNENDGSQSGNEYSQKENGIVKSVEIRDPEPQSCVKLQYDPRDVAFAKDTFLQDTLTKHYNFFYTLTEDDVEAGCLKLDPYLS